jgi:hypothetical protein
MAPSNIWRASTGCWPGSSGAAISSIGTISAAIIRGDAADFMRIAFMGSSASLSMHFADALRRCVDYA